MVMVLAGVCVQVSILQSGIYSSGLRNCYGLSASRQERTRMGIQSSQMSTLQQVIVKGFWFAPSRMRYKLMSDQRRDEQRFSKNSSRRKREYSPPLATRLGHRRAS